MLEGFGKCSRIRCIVRLRQMLRRWRDKARMSSANCVPPDVPRGHVAVCVGRNSRRYVVRVTYLNHPLFKKLLNQVEEVHGFSTNHGPFAIPCDEEIFQEVLRLISRSDLGNSTRFLNLEEFHRYCHGVSGAIWTSGTNVARYFMGSLLLNDWKNVRGLILETHRAN